MGVLTTRVLRHYVDNNIIVSIRGSQLSATYNLLTMGLVYIKDWSQDMIRVLYHVFILPE